MGLYPTVDFVFQQTHCPAYSPSNCILGTLQNTLVSYTSEPSLMDKDEQAKYVNENCIHLTKHNTLLHLQEAGPQKKSQVAAKRP